MSNKTLSILLIAVIASIGLLFAINLSNIYGEKTPQKFLLLNDISGMAVMHKQKQYTLNFEQQNNVANILNRSVKIDSSLASNQAHTIFEFDYLIIFRFDKKEIKIRPIGFVNQQMLFEAPELYSEGLLRETGPGELKPLLSTTYDTP